MKRGFVFAFLGLALSLTSQIQAAQTQRYLIELKGDFVPANLAAIVSAAGGTLIKVHPEIGFAYATSSDSRFMARISHDSAVAYVSKDRRYTVDAQAVDILGRFQGANKTGSTTDPTAATNYACQWNLKQINAEGAWKKGYFGNPNVKVAVVDSGVDPFHVELEGKVDTANSANFITPGTSPCGADDEANFYDYNLHGTLVSTMITSNNVNIAAVSPKTQVVAVKVLNCKGSGEVSELVDGMLYAAGLDDVDVINISLGGFLDFNDPAQQAQIHAVRKAVNFAARKDKLVVTVAGNAPRGINLDKFPPVGIPTETGDILAVYGTGIDGNKVVYSNFGTAAQVGAPAGDKNYAGPPLPGCDLPLATQGLILGACSGFVCEGEDQYISARGTSLSSPIAAGAAALVDGKHGGAYSDDHLIKILEQTAKDIGPPGVDKVYQHGLIDVGRASSQ